MYLLDVRTIQLREFQGSAIPKRKYAILSHTWGEDEVSFQDLQAGTGRNKEGYQKIVFTCEQAKRHGYKWAWVDTCCIDKSSSAELSESINSMFLWYKESAICYAYLVDVEQSQFPYARSNGHGEPQVSRWFTRAWTLQELIAPRVLCFYSRGWKEIGHCGERIAQIVSDATGIPKPLIESHKSLSEYSAAQKMSWAAHRSSTRPEDVAYSLLGLFDINMPLLYGEGERAFIRLQEEILKETDDHSLLCWTVPKSSPRAWTLQSVFATSPDDFTESGRIRGNLFDSGHPSAVTNRGLQIHLSLSERIYGEGSHLFHENAACSVFDAMLNAGECEPGHGTVLYQISIQLVRTPQISSRHLQSVNRYARLATPSFKRIGIDALGINSAKTKKVQTGLIYVHKNLLDWERHRFGFGGFHLQNIPIARSLCPLSTPKVDSNLDNLCIKAIDYSGLIELLEDVTVAGIPPNVGAGMTWSPIYGCITFDCEPHRISEWPFLYVIFGVECSSAREMPFSVLLVWNTNYVHFSLRPTEVQKSKYATFEKYCFEKSQLWTTLETMPPDDFTHKVDFWATYGEIARTRAVVGKLDIELILEREDPNTDDGKAAGNRSHFLIRAINHSYDPITGHSSDDGSKWIGQIEATDTTPGHSTDVMSIERTI
ncbi:HET-domain-containing protein [Annulohypoxylon truncatum]|uniref:HET-domain-containing protein n=1 Tax=Annulohypoxylon truncatum TaxID=327061 RepID=UPI002008E729|nr:HET-domain-containing protein [Annulohypoxylon truncatum]KAI1211910.1 HET-domain-containing protein [Annulohypoxylon truncatum]